MFCIARSSDAKPMTSSLIVVLTGVSFKVSCFQTGLKSSLSAMFATSIHSTMDDEEEVELDGSHARIKHSSATSPERNKIRLNYTLYVFIHLKDKQYPNTQKRYGLKN